MKKGEVSMEESRNFLKEAQEIISDNFVKNVFNEDLFNHFMCLNRQMNYSFLASYLEGLKDTMKMTVPKLSYEEMINNFIPSYRESMKHLPTSYVLFSLMNFQQCYAQCFKEFRTEKHYKEIVASLIGNETSMPFDYKAAISLQFPQYYKIKKNIKKPT